MARKGGHDRGLFERPTGSGLWWIHYHDADGRKHREKVGPKALARKRYMQRKTEIVEGRFFPGARRRVAFFDGLLDDYREAKRREGKAVMKSEIGYRRLLERFGGRRADTITAAEVEEWRDEMRESFAPATVNLHLTILRAVLRLAVRNAKLGAAALPAIAGLKANNARVRYLTDDEECRLVAALPAWLRPLITIALHTGMRRGELLKLTWDDIDFVSGMIFVRTSKSGEGRRIPMSPTAHRTLSALRQARRKRLGARVVSQIEANRYVFTAPEGGFVPNLARAWYPALERSEDRRTCTSTI